MTHRQFLGWQAWFELELNRPSRTDYYLMSVCVEIRRVLSRHPERIKHKDFLLTFQTGNGKPMSEEAAKAAAMHKWLGAVGGMGAVRVIEVDAETYNPYEEFDVQPYIVQAEQSEE